MSATTKTISLTEVQLNCLHVLARDPAAYFTTRRMFSNRFSNKAGTTRALNGLVKQGLAELQNFYKCSPGYRITEEGKRFFESLGVDGKAPQP